MSDTQEGVDVTVTPTKEAEAMEIAVGTLTGDLRDMALMWIKRWPKPWPAMSEDDQEAAIESLEKQAVLAARKAVELVAGYKAGSINLHLKNFSVEKSTLKVAMTGFATDENVAALMKLRGMNTVVRGADVEPFTGQRSQPKADPQQTSIPGTEEGAGDDAEMPAEE